MTSAGTPVARTGLATLDAVLPTLEPGQLWAVVGPRGVGVTELALSLVRHAGTEQRAARVVVSNTHLPAGAIGSRLATTPSADLIVLDSLPLPEFGRVPAWAASAGVCVVDLVVYDTVDEAYGDGHPPARDALAMMRELRRVARLQRTAVVATFRVAPTEPDRAGAARAWRAHPWHESVMDAGDVVVLLAHADTTPYIEVVIDSRVSRRASCQIRQDPRTGRFTEHQRP